MIVTDNDYGGRQDGYRGMADVEGDFIAGRADDFTVFVRVAYSCDCDYCLDKHIDDGMPGGDAVGIPLPAAPESAVAPVRAIADGLQPMHGFDMRA